MEISLDTKLAVNSYMIGQFSKKGYIGYLYFKLFVEICFEKYKELGYIPNLKLTELIHLADLDVTAQSCQRSLKAFLNEENLEGTIQDVLIDITEKIIEQSKPKLLEGDEY